jgi:hypothetical protein
VSRTLRTMWDVRGRLSVRLVLPDLLSASQSVTTPTRCTTTSLTSADAHLWLAELCHPQRVMPLHMVVWMSSILCECVRCMGCTMVGASVYDAVLDQWRQW